MEEEKERGEVTCIYAEDGPTQQELLVEYVRRCIAGVHDE